MSVEEFRDTVEEGPAVIQILLAQADIGVCNAGENRECLDYSETHMVFVWAYQGYHGRGGGTAAGLRTIWDFLEWWEGYVSGNLTELPYYVRFAYNRQEKTAAYPPACDLFTAFDIDGSTRVPLDKVLQVRSSECRKKCA